MTLHHITIVPEKLFYYNHCSRNGFQILIHKLCPITEIKINISLLSSKLRHCKANGKHFMAKHLLGHSCTLKGVQLHYICSTMSCLTISNKIANNTNSNTSYNTNEQNLHSLYQKMVSISNDYKNYKQAVGQLNVANFTKYLSMD